MKPGDTFSFNNAIGDITPEAGYVEASVVDGERIGKDVGGGICQVSTTVFRAAFLAGFPIGEWWPHLYRLAFYEYDGWTAGLDASILQSGPREDWGDFTFHNTTDGYLLIEAYVDGQTDVVTIYGPETGWDVYVSDPWEGQADPRRRPAGCRDGRSGPASQALSSSPNIVRTASRFRMSGSSRTPTAT